MLVLLPPKCFSWNLVLLVSCDSQELIKHESLIFISCSSTTFCGKPCCLLKMLKNHIKRRWVVVILIRILPAGQTLNATPQSKGRNYWWSEVFKNPSFLTSSEVTLLSKAKTTNFFFCKNIHQGSSVFFWFVCGTKNALGVSAGCLQSNKGSKRPKRQKLPKKHWAS